MKGKWPYQFLIKSNESVATASLEEVVIHGGETKFQWPLFGRPSCREDKGAVCVCLLSRLFVVFIFKKQLSQKKK